MKLHLGDINKNAVSPLWMICVSLGLFFLPEHVQSSLVFDKTQVINGHYYLIISGHFMHTNFVHFLLNVTGLVLLFALHGNYYKKLQFLLMIFFLCLFISASIIFTENGINRYVGLSGVLHGLFVWGAIEDCKGKMRTGYLLLIGVVLKIFHEQTFGAGDSIALLIDANVAIDAHLYGAIGGAIFAAIFIIVKSLRSLNSDHY